LHFILCSHHLSPLLRVPLGPDPSLLDLRAAISVTLNRPTVPLLLLEAEDVSKENEVQKMFADTVQQYGTVDILINNAGLQKDSPFETMSLEQWNFVIVKPHRAVSLRKGSHSRKFLKGV